jgi:urease accessory protein UreF
MSIGPGDDAVVLAVLSGLAPVWRQASRGASAARWRMWLSKYVEEVLIPLELPAVCHAFAHSHRSHVRELIELDLELGRRLQACEAGMAAACVAPAGWQRSIPLRQARLLRRFADAVAAGAARGWRAVVFGMVLHEFSIPLRQGLGHFSQQSLGSLIGAARDPLGMSVVDANAWLLQKLPRVTAPAQQILGPHEGHERQRSHSSLAR